ncbi:hemolysin III [Litorivivens lipolytica]|uniref:Hemolysin III n=2 Tax=Litorivivens lipolytica TaxID=1524264 RepID=A0A7W4W690_9GAMM|nr:hemolysin III [Litorivivens lipolytica]
MTTDTYTPAEDLANSLSHALGAALSLAGTVLLVLMAVPEGDIWKLVSFSIFGASLILLYLSSTLYHSFRRPSLKQAFKMLDHCAIYLLIAGTYTPFLLVNLRAGSGWTIFAVIWSLAVAGIGLKLIWGHRLKALRVIIYLVMGWLALVVAGPLADTLPTTALNLVVAGGVVYTLGVVFYLNKRIPFNHAIWHIFVIGGSACHFLAVYLGVLPFQSAA